MLKKIGLATMALAGMLAFAAPKADAAVRFGIGVGVAPVVPAVPVAPAPVVPAYPYAYPYDYPYPAYGYVGPSVDFGLGWGGWGGYGYHGPVYHSAPAYRGGVGHVGGFRGGRR